MFDIDVEFKIGGRIGFFRAKGTHVHFRRGGRRSRRYTISYRWGYQIEMTPEKKIVLSNPPMALSSERNSDACFEELNESLFIFTYVYIECYLYSLNRANNNGHISFFSLGFKSK